MIADELRALAGRMDESAAVWESNGYFGKAMHLREMTIEVRALADRLEGKVVVRPEVLKLRRPQKVEQRWTIGPQVGWTAMLVINGCEEAGDGYTEAEAIANLQAALDRGEG